MPVQVYEDSLELTFDVLEENGYTKASWPYPALKQTGHQEKRSFRAIILENEYLKLIFLPELGGRLWELLDKRWGHSHFSNPDIKVVSSAPETPQGAGCLHGFRLIERGRERLNSLAPVEVSIESPDLEEDAGSVTLFASTDQACSVQFSLKPTVATVRVEVTVQNRLHQVSDYRLSGFDSYADEELESFLEGLALGNHPKFHLWFTSEPGTFSDSYDTLWEKFQIRRVRNSATLGPRQVDRYQFDIQPVQRLSGYSFVGPIGVAHLTASKLEFCVNRPLTGHKLVIQNSEGQCFEAPFNAYPETLSTTELESIPGSVVAARISDPSGSEVATIPIEALLSVPPSGPKANSSHPNDPQTDVTILEDHELNRLTSDFTLRVPAYLELAARATERGDYQRADTCYEHALLFNGDDPLAWWAKSVNRRIGNLDDENAERTELLNAHYLSPLEPCLRAEAFLAQPRNHGKDPSPLLASFNDVPENFVEVACQLIQARFYEEAAYFIDEALRHQNLGMLHYLHAYLLSRKGGMEMEVASRVQMVTKAKFPPMPYRDLEREILSNLSEKYQLPEIISQWLAGELS
jgi:tetratricopeptide (TPR) repeat protein